MFGEKINNNRWEKTLWVKLVTTIYWQKSISRFIFWFTE